MKVEWNGLFAGHLVASEKTASLNAHETGESLFKGYWDEPFQHPWVARVPIRNLPIFTCSLEAFISPLSNGVPWKELFVYFYSQL